MYLPTHGQRGTKRLFVLVLMVSLVGFSIWLKMLPNLGMNLHGHAPASVKLWMDPSHDSDSQVRLVSLGNSLGSLLLLLLVTPALIPRMARSLKSVQARKFVARDIFSESRHWFRPPPLF